MTRCPLCAWTDALYAAQDRATKFADHVADDHTMFEAMVALMRPPEPRRPCPKVGYPTEEFALRALLQAWQRPSPRRKETRVYQCPPCGYWHLTSQPVKEKVDG